MRTIETLKSAVAGDNCTVEFTGDQIREIIRLQGEANDVMSDAWRSSNNDSIAYYRAGWIEVTEALMHIGFKWWKNEHPTEESYKEARDQAIMEIVDVMHFSASDMSRRLGDAVVGDDQVHVFYPPIYNIGRFAIRNSEEADVAPVTYGELTIQDICEQAVYAMLRDGICHWSYINVLAEAFGITADHLFATYIGKNTLNKFRTANGQREGTYKKIWDGLEDNIHLTRYLDEQVAIGAEITQVAIMEHLQLIHDSYTNMNKTELG